MHDVRVVMKDGTVVHGPLWTWKPVQGWFLLVDHVDPIWLDDVRSAIQYGNRVTEDRVENVDLLARARDEGWQPLPCKCKCHEEAFPGGGTCGYCSCDD